MPPIRKQEFGHTKLVRKRRIEKIVESQRGNMFRYVKRSKPKTIGEDAVNIDEDVMSEENEVESDNEDQSKKMVPFFLMKIVKL